MDDLGVGIIGCGFVGRGAHVPAFSSMQGVRLLAIADLDEDRLSSLAQRYRVEATFRDYRQLVEHPAVDVVVVSAPTPIHAEASLAAIRAGKHVLCEMPLATTLEAADEIIEAAREQGVVLMPSLTFRFTPSFVKAKELLGSGKFGRPVAFSYRELIPAKDLARQWPAGCWVWDVENSGGPLFTLSVWSIDLIRWLFEDDVARIQPATSYHSLASHGGTLGYDATAALQLSRGLVGAVQYSGSVAGSASDCTLEIVTESTSVIRVAEHHSVTLLADEPAETKWNVRQGGAKMWGHLQQDEHFIQCIKEGRAPLITPADGRRAMEIAQRIAKRNNA